jgi:DNA-binding response OmpR family regulator
MNSAQQTHTSVQLHRILVVTDDSLLARQLIPPLHQAGLDCQYAPDGAFGLESIDDGAPHLILLDNHLPDLNSYLMCVAIRRLSRAPILLMSACYERNLLRALEAGADGFLFKPCQPYIWTARVEAQLRRVYRYDVTSPASRPRHYPAVDEIMRRAIRRRSLQLPALESSCRLCGSVRHTLTVVEQTHKKPLCPLCAAQMARMQLAPAA